MLENPAVRAEFEALNSRKGNAVSWETQATLIWDAADRLKFRNVISENITADFEAQVADNRYITVQMGPITYRDLIVPNKDKLLIRVEKRVKSPETENLEQGDLLFKNYVALLVDPVDIGLLGNHRSQTDNEQLLENENLVTITFQLLEIEFFYQMNADTGGIYPDVTLEEVLTSQLIRHLEENQETEALKDQNFKGLRGIKTEGFENKRRYENVIVPQGVKLHKLTRLLQDKYGISPHGINTYFRNGIWFTYPLYKNKTRFSKEARTLTVFNIPKQEMPSITRSFTVRETNLLVFATGDSVVKDNSQSVENQQGNAVRFTSAAYLEKDLYKTEGNKVYINSSKTAQDNGVKESGYGVNNRIRPTKTFTVNPLPEISAMHKSRGSFVTLDWHNADESLLVPGMVTRVYFERNGELFFREGTLLGFKAATTTSSGMLTDKDYRTNCRLIVHLDFEEK